MSFRRKLCLLKKSLSNKKMFDNYFLRKKEPPQRASLLRLATKACGFFILDASLSINGI